MKLKSHSDDQLETISIHDVQQIYLDVNGELVVEHRASDEFETSLYEDLINDDWADSSI